MSHNLATCPVCGGNEIEREECVNCGMPISRFIEKKQRGGLREPKGGRPPKPIEAKYRQYPLKLPPSIIQWLEANIKNKNGFIVQAILDKIAQLGKRDEMTTEQLIKQLIKQLITEGLRLASNDEAGWTYTYITNEGERVTVWVTK